MLVAAIGNTGKSDLIMIEPSEAVPPIEAKELREAFALVYDWFEMEEENDAESIMVGRELPDLLDALCEKLNVDKNSAIALFKRSLALLALCSEENVPQQYLEDGIPVAALYTGVARASVLDIEGKRQGSMGHRFDVLEIAALMEPHN